MSLRGGVSFEAKKNELEIAAQEEVDSDTSSLSSSDEEKIGHHVNHAKKQGNAAIAPATPQQHARKLSEQFSMPPSNGNGHKVMPSMDKTSIAPSTINETTDAEKPEKGVVMSQEDLSSHRMSPSPHKRRTEAKLQNPVY
jgi:hypothetical protein